MEIITKEKVSNVVVGTSITGAILCSNYSELPTKKGGTYISGTFSTDVDIPFKVWSTSAAYTTMKSGDLNGKPVTIVGKTDNYGGIISIIVDSISLDTEHNPEDFLPIKYNVDVYWDTLKNLVLSKVSDKGKELANKVLFENEEVIDRFKVEFAAKSHHDNCKGGLLAHTYKVVANINYILSMYPRFVTDNGVVNQDMVDILYVGALLHDIGKTKEYNFGQLTPETIVTHRYLGIEFVNPHREWIIENYSLEWWYNLISIFLQHHGEFDDKCRTLVAYLIHKADLLDAQLTDAAQSLDNVFTDSTGNRVKIEGSFLNI